MSIDENNDGYITLKELRITLIDHFEEEELETILRAVDTDKNGAINYTEFIAATLEAKVCTDQAKIRHAFDQLDLDGDGFIEEKELAELVKMPVDLEKDLLI